LTEVKERFIRQLEDYYRDSYPVSMRKKVFELLPAEEVQLKALFGILIHNVSAQYRTVPDVLAVEKAIGELTELYPEYRIGAHRPLLLEDARAGTDLSALWEAMRKAFRRGENPAEAAEVKQLLKEHEL
jgi:hypothetical protein